MATTEPTVDLRGWAHRKFGLLPPASPDQARRAWSQRITAEDYFPSTLHHAAWVVLAGESLSPGGLLFEEAVIEHEEGLRGELEEFAQLFFRLDPAKRRAQLAALRHRCRCQPPLLSRLDWLENGLDVRLETYQADRNVQALADTLGELFVLPMAQCAERRRKLIADPPAGFVNAADRIGQRHPELAQLENDLIEGLCKVPSGPASHLTFQGRRFAPTPSGPEATTQSGAGWNWGWIFVAVLILRVLLSIGGGNR